MKKLFLSILACGSIAAASAQNTGLLMYGVGGYSSSRGSDKFTTGGVSATTDHPRTVGYVIAPGIGFSLNDNWAVGVQLGHAGTKTDFDDPRLPGSFLETTKTRDFEAGPFVRYTKMFNEHFFMFTQATFTYQWGKVKDEFIRTTRSEEDNFSGINANLTPAFGVRVTETVALSFGIGGINYNYRNTDVRAPFGSDQTRKESSFDVTFGQQFNIGIQKYCNWSKARRRMKDNGAEPGSDTRRLDTSDEEAGDDE